MKPDQTLNPTGRSRRGAALIVTLAIVTLAAGSAAVLYSYSGNQALMGRRSVNFLKAKSIAEAGICDAYNKLRTDITVKDRPNDLPETSFDGGTYDAAALTVISNRISLVSLGRFKGEAATVNVDLRYYPAMEIITNILVEGGNYAELYGPYLFQQVLLVGGNISWSGCGIFVGGQRAHADGSITLQGSASWQQGTGSTLYASSSVKVDVGGSATIQATETRAPVFAGKVANISGTRVTAAVPIIPIPQIQLDPFYQAAKLAGQVFTNYSLQPSGAYSVPGGVLWNKGDLSIKGTISGCLVSEGDVTLNSGCVLKPMTGGESFPTVVSRSGTIKMAGQADITGLVYAQNGGVQWTGGGNIRNGALVCAGAFNKCGNSDIITFSLPGGTFTVVEPTLTTQQKTNMPSRLVITAWQ